jgi:hypothetical protein
MIPIEHTSRGMVVFLGCGCAAFRELNHPTGEAALVRIIKPCETHANEGVRYKAAVRKGETVSPWVRTPVHLDPIRPQ